MTSSGIASVECAFRISRSSVVPERLAPTMNTGDCTWFLSYDVDCGPRPNYESYCEQRKSFQNNSEPPLYSTV